jgi:type IV pilus assembly protein PilE
MACLSCRPTKRMVRGFSLMELLAVLAIIGVLGSLALPAYLDHVARARRSDAQAVMMQVVHYLQRFHAAKNSYAGANDAAYLPASGLMTAPAGSPAAAAHHRLSVVIPADDPHTFVILAEPVVADANCGTLTLSDLGEKGVGATARWAVKDCWR